jgi:hypothetical protein
MENGLAIVAGALAVMTAVWPDWIEAVFAIDPDASSGALEWAITVLAAAMALTAAWLARVEWVRSKLADQS